MRKIYLILFNIILFNSPIVAQKSWNQKADVPGNSRNNAIGFAINGKGYFGLGQNLSGTRYNDFYEYDPSSDKWSQKANYPGAGMAGSSSFSINGKGYVCLGVNGAGIVQKELWEYNPGSNTWSQKTTFPGEARAESGCFVINDTAFIVGGNKGGSPYLTEVWMYIAANNTWTQKADFSGTGKSHGVGFTLGGIGYYGTGLTTSTDASNDVWKYNKSKDTWIRIADIPVAITGAIGFGIKDKGYIGTGYNFSSYLKEIYQYDVTSNTWTKLDTIPSSQNGRGAGVAFVMNGSAYIGTGYNSSTNSLSDFWSFTRSTSGIDPTYQKNSFIIYPNPVSKILNIEAQGKECSLSLFNLNGQPLIYPRIVDSKSQIDLSNFTKGFYYLKCVTEEGVKVIKIIKE